MASIETKTGTLKQNLIDKLKVSNAKIRAFSYTCKLHCSMCYRSRFWSVSLMRAEAVMCWNAGLPNSVK